MSSEYIKHADIVRFAEEHVNLRREHVREKRDQVNRLREKLEGYLSEHPDFSLRRMMLSGSLAKGTALKDINDIDVACYIKADDAPGEELCSWLERKLMDAFPNFRDEQVTRQTYSIQVEFRGTGLSVDIVPILLLDKGDEEQWKGYLISKDDGEQLLTSIPMHIEFIRQRKNKNETHYVQLVRLIKYWAKQKKSENSQFKLKSFMIELILAHLADKGKINFSDYREGMREFFDYVLSSNMDEKIVFDNFYDKNSVIGDNSVIQIWDPVNCRNNVARLYSVEQKKVLIKYAGDAADAITSAGMALDSETALRYWRKVLGSAFTL